MDCAPYLIWVSGDVLTAAQLNTDIRDNMGVLSIALLLPTMQSGQSYGSQGRVTAGGGTATANRLYAYPFHVPANLTTASLKGTTSATGNMRVGIYSDNAGLPGALVIESASTACASPTTTVTLSQALTGPALYWIAVVCDNTPTVTYISTNSLFANGIGYLYKAHTYGALPNPYGTPTFPALASECPNMLVTLA